MCSLHLPEPEKFDGLEGSTHLSFLTVGVEAFGGESSEGRSEERWDREEFRLSLEADMRAEIIFSPQQPLGLLCVPQIRAGDGVALRLS